MITAWWSLIRDAGKAWFNHNDSRLGAAIAYYSVFSIGPVMVIAIAIAGLAFGEDAVRGEVSTQLRSLLGNAGANAVQAMLAGAGQRREGLTATLIGVITLIVGATGVVVQLKDSLNTVWEVKPPASGGIWGFLRTYVVSLAGVLSLGFLLMLSLLLTTTLSFYVKYFGPDLSTLALQAASFLISFAITSLLFAMMYKWLPDIDLEWRDVWLGGVLTAALFETGKFIIGFYIGKSALESTYGAAASVVVLLIWVYYSAQIVLLGAEFTRLYAQRFGSRQSQPPSRGAL